MNREKAEKIADAVLYEGYMLYPYRPSAIKNRQRWTFGTLYPPAFDEVSRGTESASMHTECLVETHGSDAKLNFHLRFLHLHSRQISDSTGQEVPSLRINGKLLESWDEGTPRDIEKDIPISTAATISIPFHFSGSHEVEELRDASDQQIGSVVRLQQPISGSITCSLTSIDGNLFKLTLDIRNQTELLCDPQDRNSTLLQSLLSAHTILSATSAQFVSLLDPPDQLQREIGGCKNVGNFPVLVGDEGSRDMLLCSPIVLYDYPQIAPESAGDFFDGTEMDEMLTLRVLTLTDEEKSEMRSGDSRAEALLQRTEETARQQLMKTHGVIRSLRPVSENHG